MQTSRAAAAKTCGALLQGARTVKKESESTSRGFFSAPLTARARHWVPRSGSHVSPGGAALEEGPHGGEGVVVSGLRGRGGAVHVHLRKGKKLQKSQRFPRQNIPGAMHFPREHPNPQHIPAAKPLPVLVPPPKARPRHGLRAARGWGGPAQQGGAWRAGHQMPR